jgi:hypothetical protein
LTGRAGVAAAGCDLCEAARITPWHHEDDVCWVADCEVCGVPMVVWKSHGNRPPSEAVAHMTAALSAVADRRFGPGGWSLDAVMRQIPDHFHAHARNPNWWSDRFGRVGGHGQQARPTATGAASPPPERPG